MKKFIKPAIILLLIIGALMALQFTPLGDWLEDLVKKIEGLGPWGPVIFIAVYVVAAVCLVPASALTLGAGLAFGLGLGFVYTSIGSTLGAAAAFLLGRTLFRSKIEKKIEGKKEFQAIDKAVEEEGWKTVALSRLSPVFPYTFLNYAYGVMNVKFWPYILASFISMIPGTLLYVYLGALGNQASGDSSGGVLKNVFLGVGLVATIIVTVLITKKAKKKLDEQTDGEVDNSKEDSEEDSEDKDS